MKLRRSPLIIDTVRGKDCGCWRSDAAFPRGCRAVGVKRGSPGLRGVRRWVRKASGGRAGAPRWRSAGGDFYPQNHAQVSISDVLFPGSRPRGLPAAPPARAGGTPAETFTSKTMLRCLFRRCLAPVLAPVACQRPPRRLRPVILMVKHSTLATRDVTFPIVLRIPIYIDGETRHFGDIGRRFFDSVANWKNGISGYAVNYRPGRHP